MSLTALVQCLMRQILWYTDACFATAHVSLDKLVKRFTKGANKYVIDEVGNSTISEAPQLWRNDQDIIMSGDCSQLVPSTLSAGQVWGADSVNPLSPQHYRSLLRHLMESGFPVFVLNVQRRMCRDLFSLAHDNFYAGWPMTYADSTQLSQRPRAVAMEAWAVANLRVRPSPSDNMWPCFVHVPRSSVEMSEVTQSRSNPDQLEVLRMIMDSLSASIPGLTLGDICIITPYKAQLREIMRTVPDCASSDIPGRPFAATADSVQGGERPVVIILLVNTGDSGRSSLMYSAAWSRTCSTYPTTTSTEPCGLPMPTPPDWQCVPLPWCARRGPALCCVSDRARVALCYLCLCMLRTPRWNSLSTPRAGPTGSSFGSY